MHGDRHVAVPEVLLLQAAVALLDPELLVFDSEVGPLGLEATRVRRRIAQAPEGVGHFVADQAEGHVGHALLVLRRLGHVRLEILVVDVQRYARVEAVLQDAGIRPVVLGESHVEVTDLPPQPPANLGVVQIQIEVASVAVQAHGHGNPHNKPRQTPQYARMLVPSQAQNENHQRLQDHDFFGAQKVLPGQRALDGPAQIVLHGQLVLADARFTFFTGQARGCGVEDGPYQRLMMLRNGYGILFDRGEERPHRG